MMRGGMPNMNNMMNMNPMAAMMNMNPAAAGGFMPMVNAAAAGGFNARGGGGMVPQGPRGAMGGRGGMMGMYYFYCLLHQSVLLTYAVIRTRWLWSTGTCQSCFHARAAIRGLFLVPCGHSNALSTAYYNYRKMQLYAVHE